MCCGLCTFLTNKCCLGFLKLIIVFLLLDLCLTCFITISLWNADVFACCTSTNDIWNTINANKCTYEDIGKADDIDKSSGYCFRGNGDTCETGLESCALASPSSISLDELCKGSTLEDVANYNWNWLTGLLITKMTGLLFLIFLEVYSCRKSCDEKSKGNTDSEPGEEDAENTIGCCDKCQECTADCCASCLKNLTILLLKLFFLIFGTIVTFLVLTLLSEFNKVTWGSCNALDGDLKSDCKELSNKDSGDCIGNGQRTIYNVVFADLDLDGPFWLNVGTSLCGCTFWIARFFILRQRLNSSKLSKV